ncbi:MAG: septum formation initiator family protein [Roseburia sp.]|nr:septum formation initiator family protein [Roseburia sp.]
MAKKRKSARQDDNRVGKICISLILIIFVAVMAVQINKVYKKDQEMISREAELRMLLEDELERQEELKEYQEYIESTEYVEDVAESKLGLLYDNQIIFRENEN